MTKTAATSYEVRWRKNTDPVDQWSTPVVVGADGHVNVPGLERVTDYTFEARAVSACGAKSAWATQTFNLPGAPTGTITLAGVNANTPNVINPQFADGANGWTLQQGWAVTGGVATFTGYAGAVNNAIYNTRIVRVTPGQQVTVQATLTANGASGTCGACVAWFDSAGTWQSFSSRGAAVTGTAGATLSRAVAVVPANVAYAAAAADVWSGTAGTFTADDFIMTPTLASVDELPDGAGRFAVVNGAGMKGVSSVDANNRAGIDFTQTLHIGKVLDNIGDTGSYVRTPATSWHPENVPNASFTSPAVNGAVPGWGATNATLSITPAGGPFALQVVAIAGGVAGAYFTPSNACQPGDVVAATVTCDVTAGNSPTARVQVQCFDVNGNALTPTGSVDVVVTSAYNTQATATALATMPANAASFRLFAYVNSNAGATFLILNPRVSVNDLRVAGSGSQVGDQRNLHPITVASLRSVLNISPITYTITSGSPNSTVNFSVAAFTLRAGSAAINYNAASHSIAQANGTTTTWYLLFIDPGYAGGTQSLVVTTSPTVAAQYDGAVNIGNATVTVASGGGGSSGSGSGGGGWCVCDDMWIDAETQAKDAQPGHVFDCCDLPTRGTETFKRALQSADYHDEECVRLTTEGGAVLDCGHTTPFDTVDGCVLRAPDMLGELVLTDHGLQKVVDVEWIGMRHVCYFHFGGISYAAGRDTRPWWLRVLPQWLLPKRLRRNVNRIYSHNTAAKP